MRRRALVPLAGSVALLVALVACGGDDDAGSGTTDPSGATADVSTPEGSIPEMSLVPTSTVPVPDVNLPENIPTELVVTEITPGTGEPAVAGDQVFVNYVGVRSEDGTQFDTNFGAEPYGVTLGAGGVIAGWDQGLVGVTQGERLQLDIPNDLAYKDQPQGDVIQAGDALSFVIDVRAIVPATDPTAAPTATDLPLSSELVEEPEVTDLREGDGATLEAGQTGIFHLVAARADDGTVLQSTWESTPIPVTLEEGQLIPEVLDGLPGMKVGGRRLVRVPSSADMGLTPETDVFIVADLYAVY